MSDSSSSSSSQPLLADRDYEQDRRDGALDRPLGRIACMVSLVVLMAVFTIAGLVTRYDLYNKTTSVTLGAGDSWSVSVQQSSLFRGVFCSEYSVQVTNPKVSSNQGLGDGPQPGGTFSIIALSAQASFAEGLTKRSVHETGILGAYAVNKYFVYHVSEPDGCLTVSLCSNQTEVSVSSCRDEKDARRFITDGPNSGACSSDTLCKFNKCGGSQPTCRYGVPPLYGKQMYSYIFVVYRTLGKGTGGESVQIDFNISSLVYNMDKKVASCDNANGSCVLPVPMVASDIVLQTPNVTITNPVHLEGNCISRVPIYICIFVGLPLAIVLVFGGCALCLMKTQANVIKATDQADRTREYRSLGRRQNELEHSDFLRPRQSPPPPPPSYPEDGNIQEPTSAASLAERSVAV